MLFVANLYFEVIGGRKIFLQPKAIGSNDLVPMQGINCNYTTMCVSNILPRIQ